jgi:RNA-binding protein
MSSLGKKQLHHLRQLAHDIKPIIIVGNKGLTENVIEEIKLALEHHELIKVRVNAGDREARSAMIEKIKEECEAEIVISVGHIVGLYKKADEPKIILPK